MAKWELMALRSGGLAVEVREQAWALPVPVARGLRVQRPARWILARWILDPWVAQSGARVLVDPPQAVPVERCWLATRLLDATPEACSQNCWAGVVLAILVARRWMRWLEDSVMQRARYH